ncbi:MAG TPA: hypothetical protein VGN17_00390 [Bryobacteraceae bacterium]|jgi:hypothetical protein
MSVSRLLFIDGFEDYDVRGQAYNYYTTSQLFPYPGRGNMGAQGGASITLQGEEPTLTIGFAYRLLNIIPAISMPVLTSMANNVSGFSFGLIHYDDNASATAVSSGGIVTISVTHGGSYYDDDNPPLVLLQSRFVGGTYDHIDVTVSGGRVISAIVYGSSGYDDMHPPSVYIAPGGRAFRTFSGQPGSVSYDTPSTKFIRPGVWNYFEFTATSFLEVDVFSGRFYAIVVYKLKVNGVTFLDSAITSPENDLGQSDFLFASIGFNTNIIGVFDDLYITDGELLADGLFTNHGQGLQVKTLFVNGPGAYNDLTPSVPGAENWKMVKDAKPDRDATYVSADKSLAVSMVLEQDTYALQDLPLIYTDIRGAQANFYVKKSAAGPCSFQGLLGDTGGGVNVVGTWYPSFANYDAFYTPMRYHNGSTWTRTVVNDAQLGFRKSS